MDSDTLKQIAAIVSGIAAVLVALRWVIVEIRNSRTTAALKAVTQSIDDEHLASSVEQDKDARIMRMAAMQSVKHRVHSKTVGTSAGRTIDKIIHKKGGE